VKFCGVLHGMMSRDVWIYCIAPKLSVLSLVRLSRVNKLFYSYFASNSRIVKWQKRKSTSLLWRLSDACYDGDIELAEFFVSGGVIVCNWALYYASLGGHRSLVDFIIPKISRIAWEWGLYGAVRGGHISLVEFYLPNLGDETDWQTAISNTGNEEIINLLRNKMY